MLPWIVLLPAWVFLRIYGAKYIERNQKCQGPHEGPERHTSSTQWHSSVWRVRCSLQHQMPLFRKKMVWEILHQQLLWECPPLPLAAGGSFPAVSIYLMHHGLPSPCVLSVLPQVLSCHLAWRPLRVWRGCLWPWLWGCACSEPWTVQPTQEQTLVNVFLF